MKHVNKHSKSHPNGDNPASIHDLRIVRLSDSYCHHVAFDRWNEQIRFAAVLSKIVHRRDMRTA